MLCRTGLSLRPSGLIPAFRRCAEFAAGELASRLDRRPHPPGIPLESRHVLSSEVDESCFAAARTDWSGSSENRVRFGLREGRRCARAAAAGAAVPRECRGDDDAGGVGTSPGISLGMWWLFDVAVELERVLVGWFPPWMPIAEE
jgi:hypothetical protein